MSFWSSLVLARAAKPPVVTARDLGLLVRTLAADKVLIDDEKPLCQIKYGPRVDVDERGVDVVVSGNSGDVITYGEYPWDLSERYGSLAELAETLSADGGTVYRAFLSLGQTHPSIVAALTRDPCEENSDDLCMYSASFSVGPVMVAGLASETAVFAGWMGLAFSGQGYYFPWEYRKARERAEQVELVRSAVETCRKIWPVGTASVSADVVAARKQAGELWLYDDHALQPNWLWFASESG